MYPAQAGMDYWAVGRIIYENTLSESPFEYWIQNQLSLVSVSPVPVSHPPIPPSRRLQTVHLDNRINTTALSFRQGRRGAVSDKFKNFVCQLLSHPQDRETIHSRGGTVLNSLIGVSSKPVFAFQRVNSSTFKIFRLLLDVNRHNMYHYVRATREMTPAEQALASKLGG